MGAGKGEGRGGGGVLRPIPTTVLLGQKCAWGKGVRPSHTGSVMTIMIMAIWEGGEREEEAGGCEQKKTEGG